MCLAAAVTALAQEKQAAAPAQETKAPVPVENVFMWSGTALSGEAGLWRVTSGEPLKAFSAHMGAHGEYFYYNGFLFKNDVNQRGAADFSLGVVPYDNLELFFLYQAVSAYNNKTVPTYQMSMGSMSLGLKYAHPVHKTVGVGGSLGFGFNTGPGGKFFDMSAVSYTVKAVATFDGRGLASPVPVRVHFNAGGYLIFPDKKFRDSFKVWEHYMLNINLQKQGLVGLALDFPIDRAGIMPFVEATLGWPDGPGYVTPGFKWRPSKKYDFTIDFYTDIGVLRGTPALAPNTQIYNLILGASFGLSPFPADRVLKEQVVVVEKVPEKAETGLIRGLVVDSANEVPVGNVIVILAGTGLTNMATDPLKGDFVTAPLKPGPYKLVLERDGYHPTTVEAEVKAGKTTPVKVSFKRRIVEGDVVIKVVDHLGKPVEGAEVQAFTGARFVNLLQKKESPGTYLGRIEQGKWYVVAKAEGKVSMGRVIDVLVGKTTDAEIQLRDKPKEQLITVEKDRILLLKKIHFELNSARITGGDSFMILDMIIDAINNNPKLKRVKIEGHTDDTGSREINTQLSRDRANSVRDYLIRWGISPELLEAEGYGPDRPIESNKTQRGRDANRRVEFILLEQ
jgi:outer membrane protein OmpA-like peptidoglycan-associated protein